MIDTFMQFHLLRPEWLLGLFVLPVVWLWFARGGNANNDWSKAIDAQLLQYLTPKNSQQNKQQNKFLVILILALCIFALSGPTWKQKPQPVMQMNDDMVVLFDLSLSMLATDLSPNRLTRVKQKLQDLLTLRTEGSTALVVFSGDSHVVTPLTDDTKTILATLPALDPFMMPVIGSRPDLAVEQALALFEQAGSTHGRIVLITDGVEDHQSKRIQDYLSDRPIRLDVLAVGTPNGAPIDLPDRGYLKDGDQVVIAKTDLPQLASLASANRGSMTSITLTDDDLKYLDISGERQSKAIQHKESAQETRFDTWEDLGYIFLIAIIPLVLLAYRQGLLIVLVVLLYPNEQAQAFEWNDLWQTSDQQAQKLLQEGEAKQAAELFENPAHKAYAQYQAGDFKNAEQTYRNQNVPDAQYNLANSLAKQQRFEEALETYNQVLEADPNHADAQFNKQIVEQILAAQQSQSDQNNQQQNDEQQQNSEQQNSENKDSKQDQQDQSQQQDQQKQQGAQNQQDEQSNAQQQQQQNQQQDQTQNENRSEQDQQSSEDEQNQEREENAQQPQVEEKSAEEQAQEQQQAMAESMPNELSEEEKQSFEQWMRRVPDDPGGLLRRKFEQQARERNHTSRDQGEPLW